MLVERKLRSRVVRVAGASIATGASIVAGGGCGGGEPAPLFEPEEVERDFVEVVSCVPSQSHAFQVSTLAARGGLSADEPRHEDRHVSTFADPASTDLFERCVLGGEGECSESRFPSGTRVVTLHYNTEPCGLGEPVAYTAAERLEGDHPAGEGWRWQWVSSDLQLLEDGAPELCTRCHIDRCSEPEGFDRLCGQETLPL